MSLSVALKETCRVVNGAVPLWPFHRARLAAGGCDEALLTQIDARALAAAAKFPDRATHRAMLTVIVCPDATITVHVSRRFSSLDVPGGPLIARADVVVAPTLAPGPAKSADRSAYDEYHSRARSCGAHEAVLVGPGGRIIDGSTANVWIVEAGTLLTPPSPPAVPGVARAFVLARLARDQSLGEDVETRTEPITWQRFEFADEAFLTNAAAGAVPVRGRGGATCGRVRSLFAEAWRY